MKDLLMVGIGGFAGSVLRYLISNYGFKNVISIFPFHTLLINLLGSLLLGFLVTIVIKSSANPWQLMLTVGFCGGFTTFSTFSLESIRLFKEAQYFYLSGYLTASVLGGILFGLAGIFLAQKLAA